MKYFNLSTKQVQEMDDKFFELVPDKNNWIDNDIVENKIVIVSINDYRVFPKDELGLYRDKVLSLLEYFKPATEEIAKKIGRYYKICPYCLKEIEDENKVLLLDCRGQFSNIRKMQLDAYYEAYCCGCNHEIPFSKIQSVANKAKYITESVRTKELTLIKYTVDCYDILIDMHKFVKLDFSELIIDRDFKNFIEENKDKDNLIKEATLRNLDDFNILREIFERNLYLAVRKNGEILLNPDTKKILNIMSLRKELKL